MINFSINKTLFLQALNTTKRAISSKMLFQSFPRLKLMSLQKDLLLSGSNGQISIENFISIKDENAGLLVTFSRFYFIRSNFLY